MKCSENAQSHLTEWYVNGPSYVCFGSAEGKVIQYCTIERFLSNRNQINSTNTQLANCFSTEFIWGKNKDFKFLIIKISTFGPKWSTNVGIEYHKDWGRIPEPDERLKIEELCSFVFGKHLLSVGHTAYDKDENIVEVYAHSPWGHSTKYFCSKPEYPPIQIHDPSVDAEKIINYLLPKYLELSEPLCLEEALWNYWISCDIPPGPNLPIIASAIETIIHPWYNWKKTKSHGVYLEKNEFDILLQKEIESIKEKLAIKYDIINKPEQKKYYEKIINNISIANQFTFTDRFLEFFKEIGLNVTQAEIKAIKERHFLFTVMLALTELIGNR